MTTRRWSLAMIVGLLAAVALPASGEAAEDGSILHLKRGKLWLVAPDGDQRHRVRHSGRFEFPSQADKGTIVAQRGIKLHRLNRRGRPLNKPFTTPFRTNPVVQGFQGPFSPEVSPNGRNVAYTYAYTASYYDYGCNCSLIRPSMNTAYTRSNRFTDEPKDFVGPQRMYSNASWIDDRQLVMTTGSLYDFSGNVLDQIAVDPLGGGEDSYQSWFSECTGCESIETLKLHPVAEAEMTRQRDKLVVVSGPLDAELPGAELFIYPLSPGMPPGIPQHHCRVTGASGDFTSPSWSPDGGSLAWQDDRGIWVGRVGDLSGETCEVTRRLVVAGGSSPDWGPARP